MTAIPVTILRPVALHVHCVDCVTTLAHVRVDCVTTLAHVRERDKANEEVLKGIKAGITHQEKFGHVVTFERVS